MGVGTCALKKESWCTLFTYFSLAVILLTFLKSLNFKTGLDEQCPILRERQVRDHLRDLNMYKSERRKMLHSWVLRKLEDIITKTLPFLKRVKRYTGSVILTLLTSKIRNRYSCKWCWNEWNTERWLETVVMALPREKCAGLLQWPLMMEELHKWTKKEILMCLPELP